MVEKQRTLIVGAGIVGAATAFFISRHPKFNPDNHEIVIIESVAPACGASGKAGGLLSKSAFPQNLGPLSYKLHAKLAQEYDGENKWGYRKVSTVSLEGSEPGEGSGVAEDEKVDRPKSLDWVRDDVVEYAEVLGRTGDFAQVHPWFLTNFLINHTKEKGVLRVITGHVNQLTCDVSGRCTGAIYKQGETERRLDADNVIVTAGPWTAKLIENCPVVGMKVPSITVKPSEPVSAYAMFTELNLADGSIVSPEVYARKDEIYICGEQIDDPLPETAAEITVDDKYGDALFNYGSILSDQISKGNIKRRQACYLPVVDSPYTSGPFVGKTNVPRLFLAAGHTCWGINNAPATGLLMAECLFDGQAHTSNIKALTPATYFDSSPALTRSL